MIEIRFSYYLKDAYRGKIERKIQIILRFLFLKQTFQSSFLPVQQTLRGYLFLLYQPE